MHSKFCSSVKWNGRQMRSTNSLNCRKLTRSLNHSSIQRWAALIYGVLSYFLRQQFSLMSSFICILYIFSVIYLGTVFFNIHVTQSSHILKILSKLFILINRRIMIKFVDRYKCFFLH